MGYDQGDLSRPLGPMTRGADPIRQIVRAWNAAYTERWSPSAEDLANSANLILDGALDSQIMRVTEVIDEDLRAGHSLGTIAALVVAFAQGG